MADRFWISAGSSNFNNTANWSTTNGGGGGASVPGNTDRARFTSSGVGSCQFDLALTGQNIHVDAGYTGTLDAATDNLNHTIGNGTSQPALILIDNGAGSNPTWAPGTGLWTINATYPGTNGTVALGATETFLSSGNWRVLTNGSMYWELNANDVIRPYEFTIGPGIVTWASTGSLIASGGTFVVQNGGTLSLASTSPLGNGTYTVDSGGTISSTAILTNGFTTGATSVVTFVNNGTISCFISMSPGNTLVSTFDGTGEFTESVTIIKSGGTNGGTLTIKGSLTFSGKFLINKSSGGLFTVDNNTNNPDITFKGDVEFIPGAGGIAWNKGTGTIIFGGSADQRIEFDGETIEDIEIDKSAGVCVLAEAFTCDSIHGIAGTLDVADVIVTVTGNVTIDAGFHVRNSSLVVTQYAPTANSGIAGRNAWTASAGNKWDCVDEVGANNGDTDYIGTTTNTVVQHFLDPSISISAGAIVARLSVVGVGKWVTGTTSIIGRVFKGSTSYLGTSVSMTSSYVSYSFDWKLDPSTLTPWSTSAINAGTAFDEFGFETNGVAAGEETRITQCYVEIAAYVNGGSAGRLNIGGSLDINGTSGSHVTWSGVDLDVTGTADADYCDVNDSNATFGTTVTATNSTDNAGNTNWSFGVSFTFSGFGISTSGIMNRLRAIRIGGQL
jgi:hypothetical protein